MTTFNDVTGLAKGWAPFGNSIPLVTIATTLSDEGSYLKWINVEAIDKKYL